MIELIVYVTLFIILSVSAFQLIVSAFSVYRHAKLWRTVNVEGEAALQMIIREVRDAYAVDDSLSAFDINPGTIALRTFAYPTGTATTSSLIRKGAGGAIELIKGTTTVSLTNDAVLQNLVFRSITTPKSRGIRVELTLTASSSVASTTSSFYGTAVLRGSY